jgi:predicted CxxxxCH...CXXCH cytochrome family protein
MRIRAVALALLTASACTSRRPRPGEESCDTWREDVEPLLRSRCAECHDDLGDYASVLRTATAGDPGSPLVSALDPEVAEPIHDAVTDVHARVRAWVVDCGLAYFDSDLHAPGIMNPADGEFHGALLRDLGWDFPECASCHGDDFSGGVARSSCLGCHEDGPTSCTTCHGTAPSSGAHLAHTERFGCSECHRTPETWDAPGHLDAPPAEVIPGAFAALDVHPERRQGPPAYDAASGTCRNVYCHGDPFGDSAAGVPEPGWSGGPSQAACGACHGLPPSDHAPGPCETCHGVFESARHVDGVVGFATGLPGCSACHGDTASPAPTDGGHQSHVFASRLRGPVSCSQCHVVPEDVRSPGHIDSGAPAEVAMSSWDATSRTCSGGCHGEATIVWTAIGIGAAACGTCHGIPPTTAAHDPGLTLTDCASCHPATVDPFGNIVVSGGSSAHIDGEVGL